MDTNQIPINGLPQVITAIGGIGTAAFGVVDATKVFWGGANRIGFGRIVRTVSALTPKHEGLSPNALSLHQMIETLRANWYNGTDLASQKAIAKSLIKLHLNSGNAAAMAKATGVDPAILTAVAASIATGTALTTAQSDVYGRFDLILTARLDETYQRADQVYRNGTRALAALVSLLLALVGHGIVPGVSWRAAILVGLLAVPLAPIAKDLSSALAATVNTLQLVKK